MTPAAVAPEVPFAARPIRPLASLRARLPVAAAVAVLGVGASLVVAVRAGHPVYMAQADIRVSPTFARVLKDDPELQFPSNTQYRQFVQQQVREFSRLEVGLGALDRLGDRRPLWQQPGETAERAAERLVATVAVRAVPDTYLITVSLRGSRPDGLAELVNAMVEGHIAQQRVEQGGVDSVRAEQLAARRRELEQSIQRQSRELEAFAQELGITTFEEKFLNPYDRSLVDAEQARASARRERIEAEAKHRAHQASARQSLALDIDAAAEEALRQDRPYGDISTVLEQRRNALLDRIQGLGPEHPRRRAVERELAAVDRELAQARAAMLGQIREVIAAKRATQLEREGLILASSVEQSRRSEEDLVDHVNTVRARTAWFTARYTDALNLRSAIDRDRKLMAAIDDRRDFLSLESTAPGFLRVVSPARTPTLPIQGGRTRLFLLGLVGALAVALVLPAGLDMIDRRVLFLEDVEPTVGAPPLGVVGPPSARIAAPDQSRRVALALQREQRARGRRRIVVTGVGGRRTWGAASRLGREIGALGSRALVVATFEIAAERGGRVAPAGASAPPPSIVAGTAGDPDTLVLDPLDTAPLDRVADAVAAAGREYDVVLVAAPPILNTAEVEALVAGADGVLIAVEAEGASRTDLGATAREIARLSPPVVAFVVTRDTPTGKDLFRQVMA